MRISQTFGLTLTAVFLFCGCQRDSVGELKIDGDPLELVSRFEQKLAEGKPLLIEEMTSNDVIVAVNGYPLTKQTYDEMMVLKAKYYSNQKDANPMVVEKQMEQARPRFIADFIGQRLLLDNARELGVTTTNKVNEEISARVAKVARAKKKTVEQFLRSVPDRRYFLYELAMQRWIDALVAQKIPPKVAVDQSFVSNVQAQVEFENAATVASNKLLKAKLEGWRAEIVKGTAKFEDLAVKYSQDLDKNQPKGGFWGEFERGEMDDRNVQAVAFSTPVGQLTPVVEDEDGFHLIKVLSSKPPEKNEAGRVIRKETRQLAHIYLEKEPLILTVDDEEMTRDMKQQMQLRAIDDYTQNLRTNGQNRVEFPHGTKLFK